MSRENVELIRRAYELWNSRDWRTLAGCYDPDAVVRPPEGWPEPGAAVGREEVIRTFERVRDTFDADEFVPAEFVDAGDRVLVRGSWRGTGRGPEMVMEWTNVFTIRRGRIVLVEYFWDHAEALEAAGLAEQS
jgi:ketosteroid isomerase-like protein